jgi:hypothetical protein
MMGTAALRVFALQNAIPLIDRSITDCLIIFTRYPLPGKAKTRLIPAIGAEAAAQLQRKMTEHTLRQAWIWQAGIDPETRQRTGGKTEIWFARSDSRSDSQSDSRSDSRSDSQSDSSEASDQQQMQAWLGSQWHYRAQPEGNLGDRLIQAIQAAFATGMQRVVTIGTDCPGLNATRMRQAFTALDQADLVLGPALDGGYYLIGLRQFVPDLFAGIAWSTATVLQQTVEIAERLGLTVAYLEPLSDVDRAADLPVWQAIEQAQPWLSVVVPAFNEENRINPVVQSIRQTALIEIIVVDGGSDDRTVDRAMELGVTVLQTALGRSLQMNAGANAAAGKVLLFLHADTQLPSDFLIWIQQILMQPGTVAGAFELKIDGVQPGLRWVEWGVKWRSRLLQLPYGDQAIFVPAEIFQQTGGFPDLPIMEDFEWVRRLRHLGKIGIAPAPVLTSGRRWQQVGIWRTTWINQLVIAAYFLGLSPDRIARWYRGAGKLR